MEIITQETLGLEATETFLANAVHGGRITATDIAVARMVATGSRFAADGGHEAMRQRTLVRLGAFFDWLFGLSSGSEQ